MAQAPKAVITATVDESRLVTLTGNIPSPALDPRNDRGRVDDSLALEHMILLLKRSPENEAALRSEIDAIHDSASPQYHRWLSAQELGTRFGVAPHDTGVLSHWLESQGFTVNLVRENALMIDFSGTAGQVSEAFHTEIHNLVLANGDKHVANVSNPEIPAALAPAVEGIASLHDFFPKPHLISRGTASYDRESHQWHPHFTISSHGETFHAVGPYDFATIYNLLPLWKRGFTGKGVTIATVEDSNLANPSDWSTFRQTFGLDTFTSGTFTQVYPNCTNPGANGDEVEADLDVEWASAAAPDAAVELSACKNTKTTSGLDLAILGILEAAPPPEIISDSYGFCETITGQTEIALENSEAQQAAAEGITYFIAQGDTGADECAPGERTRYSTLGINSGDNTASAYAVDVGGTDFQAQYNFDVYGIPVSDFWSATNNPQTLASALSYIPEIPWNDSCASQLIYSDPVNGGFSQSYGASGFCNSSQGNSFLDFYGGSGGPSTCFTGQPSIPGVVSGTCQGNPKPSYQTGVPGIPNDGLRDQPDLAFFAADGVWGSFYVECFSDTKFGGSPCTAKNDALMEGGGGTSFASPAMAGIQALIDQQYGKQGNANTVYYKLAAQQFKRYSSAACNASQTNGGLPGSYCVFNDVQLGDMDIPCGQNKDGNYYDCYGAASPIIGELSTSNSTGEPAYPATIGYDLATGLGSVNATNLFDAWPNAK